MGEGKRKKCSISEPKAPGYCGREKANGLFDQREELCRGSKGRMCGNKEGLRDTRQYRGRDAKRGNALSDVWG